jgi:hypothetical protein
MEEESSVIQSLERRAGFLRSEIRRVDAMIEELRKVDALLAYYKGREKVGSHTLSFFMPDQPEIRVSENDRRNREIMAAVRRILLTEPTFEARVNAIFDRLPEEVRGLIGGKDARVASEILRHRIRDVGDAFGLAYDRGMVTMVREHNRAIEVAALDTNESFLRENIGKVLDLTFVGGAVATGIVMKTDAGWVVDLNSDERIAFYTSNISRASIPVLTEG